MDELAKSWNSFSSKIASEYLKTYGNPSITSKEILVDILKTYSGSGKISIIDLGCGNAQLYEYFKSQKFVCTYTGVDFSAPLLEAARRTHTNDPYGQFIVDDVNYLDNITEKYDFAIYSHVIEMLPSPEKSLLKAKTLANKIIIRFFVPPEFESDEVELREMDVGDGKKVPYLRRKMSRDYYRLILTKMGCTQVDVYRDKFSKDQVHVLHY